MQNYGTLFQRYITELKQIGISLNPPASQKAIAGLESLLGKKLPQEIFNFYRFCNGFETNDYIFRVIPIEEIMEYQYETRPSSFYFAEYLIYSDSWTIQLKSPEQYVIVNGNHRTEEEVVLTDSVYNFLEKYLHGEGIFGDKGLYSWYKEEQEKNNQ